MTNPSDTSVTVVIPAYNAEPFIRRAVDSALRQSKYVTEVLIVDDGSTDGTVAEALTLTADVPRVRLIRLAVNSGPAAARNRGFSEAKGDWIAVLDADDAFRPSRVQEMIDVGIETSADILIDSFCYFTPATNQIGSSVLSETGRADPITIEEFVEHARPFTVDVDWGLLKPVFRSSFIKRQALAYPEYSRHGEDFLLMVEGLARGGKLVLLRRAGYLYTERAAGQSRTSINYGRMYEHTVTLMDDPRFASNKRLKQAFAARVRALGHLIQLCEYRQLRLHNAYATIAWRVICDRAFRSMVGFLILRRLGLV